MRTPTDQERQKERSIAFTFFIDVGVVLLIVIFAIMTSSLTLISEGVRSSLMLLLLFYSLRVLKSVHRGKLVHLEFGAAKLENFMAALVGVALFLSGLWVTQKVFDTIFSAHDVASPFQLALAALVNGLNTAVNVIAWLDVRASQGGHESEVFKAQLHGRFVMMVSSLILQTTLTAAALARDPVVALGLDALGASFVAVIMLRNGYLLVRRAMPTLLDARAPEQLRELIEEKVAQRIPYSQVGTLRTRQLGDTCIAEITILPDSTVRADDLSNLAASLEEELRRVGHHVDLYLVPEQAEATTQGTTPKLSGLEPSRS